MRSPWSVGRLWVLPRTGSRWVAPHHHDRDDEQRDAGHHEDTGGLQRAAEPAGHRVGQVAEQADHTEPREDELPGPRTDCQQSHGDRLRREGPASGAGVGDHAVGQAADAADLADDLIAFLQIARGWHHAVGARPLAAQLRVA